MEKYFSIGEMASIHHISRQALIYYDKIDLFKPIKTDDHGYRYYSPSQIPLLREILFLKSIGIKLDTIKEHIQNRNLTTAISLLESHKETIEQEIEQLKATKGHIENRLSLFATVENFKNELYQPMIETFPERKVIFVPFEHQISRKELHLTVMKAWDILNRYSLLPSEGFGTIIRKESLEENDVFRGAGSCIMLPDDVAEIENMFTLPAGEYACMFKYGMPYETQFLDELIEWIHDNHYQVAGDVFDACLLDSTFYGEDQNSDFCQLQIPVKKC
ncbi:MerR family transcriptional regulator [Weizmannia acidilactici]|uniref:MerR family transcriptional regulator n=1 Tax=Weizmannia acidilactici TaxID=2607726 RepID=A0A5J4JKR7_9BACI|nr:MerR family transcriptional regulator [Weizmannia acidilactici]GER67560.1 MerR family transcriptional regulator [Weizmannia acidilactici]GER71285.1 MerR family transcriptional regulator [Weizmannia acidilactici]GER74719.1 MerR family transcriptional regulator [Weizmannia acidilactici]